MATQTETPDRSVSTTIDYVLLVGCVTIIAIKCFDLLTAVPETYPSQHWKTLLLSFTAAAGLAERLSSRPAVKRSLTVLAVISFVATVVLIVR